MSLTDPTIAELHQSALSSINRVAIPLATDGSGACTAYSPQLRGQVLGYHLDIGSGGTALANSTDIAVTENDTGAPLLSLSNVSASTRVRPRVPTHDVNGRETGALDAPAVVGMIKVVIAEGGSSRSGILHVYLDGAVVA